MTAIAPLYLLDSTTRLANTAAQRKLSEFAELPEGWHFGTGSAISAEVLGTAEVVLSIGLSFGLKDVSVFPSESGQVGVAFHDDDETIEAIIGLDGTLEVFKEVGSGLRSEMVEHAEDVALYTFYELLQAWMVPERSWATSQDSSILGTWKSFGNTSRTLPLLHLAAPMRILQTAGTESP